VTGENERNVQRGAENLLVARRVYFEQWICKITIHK
jgi:hypothetical protein